MKTAAALVGGIAGFGITFLILALLLDFQNVRPWHQFLLSFREKGINVEGLIPTRRKEKIGDSYNYYATVTYAVQYRGRNYFVKHEFRDEVLFNSQWDSESVQLLVFPHYPRSGYPTHLLRGTVVGTYCIRFGVLVLLILILSLIVAFVVLLSLGNEKLTETARLLVVIWVISSIVLCYPSLKASTPDNYLKCVKLVIDDENVEMDIQDPANEQLSLLPKIDEGEIQKFRGVDLPGDESSVV